MKGELFDPNAPLSIDEHHRPHWSQTGATVFVTFRTRDSIPRNVIKRWDAERFQWLQRRGVNCRGDFSAALRQLSSTDARAFRKRFNRQREDFLDSCHGTCILRKPDLAQIVADSLLYFDGERYHMGDFVVMPNHVHLLASFHDAERMRRQFGSWLRWTAMKINSATGAKGHFWQEEPFDHLVRSNAQLEYLRKYIKENPLRAKLKKGEYLLRICPD
ncbi:MAG: transposase [Planctomycetota bacterium]